MGHAWRLTRGLVRMDRKPGAVLPDLWPMSIFCLCFDGQACGFILRLNSQIKNDIDLILRNERNIEMIRFKIIVEKHSDGYVAYPLGMKGVVVAEGDTYEQALAEVKSAIQFHLDTFGKNALAEDDSPVMEAFKDCLHSSRNSSR